jgi:hypothetical protein
VKDVAERVRRKGRTRCARLLAPDFLPVALEDDLGLGAQQRDFLFGEAAGHEQVALLVERGELLGSELDGGLRPDDSEQMTQGGL